jgi:hypothetical protein
MSGVKIKERCIELVERDGHELCTKFIRLVNYGRFLSVELVKRDSDNGEEVVNVLAQLPRETYYVSEPYFGEFFAAYEAGRLFVSSWDWSGLLRKLRARWYYVSSSKYLSASEILIPRVEKTVSVGLSDDGDVVDPLGILDKTDYGAEPLKAAYEWIKSAYAGKNAEYAWYNVIAAITYVATSPLRTPYYLENHFLDYVVYNVVPYGYGAIMHVLEGMLGGAKASIDYYTVIFGEPLKVYLLGNKRLAATLLDLYRLPLVLVGQTKKTLKAYKYVLKSAGGGFITLDRQGKKRIPNLRGLIIFADDLHDTPAPRRLVLRWDPSLTYELHAKPLSIKPIYGFAVRLWRKYRDRFATINKLPYLVASVAKAIAQEIRDEAEEVATFTECVVDKLTDAFINGQL